MKIALSTQVNNMRFCSENEVGTKGPKRSEIYLDIKVPRTDLDALVGGEVEPQSNFVGVS